MQIEIDNNYYEVNIVRKNNKNTYIRVKDGKIVVTTNRLTTNGSIKKLILENTIGNNFCFHSLYLNMIFIYIKSTLKK